MLPSVGLGEVVRCSGGPGSLSATSTDIGGNAELVGVMRSWTGRLRASLDDETRRSILALVERNADAVLLDTGCGDGHFTARLGQAIGTEHLQGVEIAWAAWPVAEKASGIAVRAADLNFRLPYEDASFDVVHSNQVIEHLYNTDLYVGELLRVLRPGGYVIVSTPNLAAWYNVAFLVVGLQPPTCKVSDRTISTGTPCDLGSQQPVDEDESRHLHLRIFTQRALRELFESSGFSIEKVSGAGFYPCTGRFARLLSRIDTRHAVALVMKARKPEGGRDVR